MHHGSDVDAGFVNDDAVLFAVGDQGGDFAGVEQGLGGDAADVEAGSAQVAGFDEGDALLESGQT